MVDGMRTRRQSGVLCINLKFIRFGEGLWAWEHKRVSTDTPTDEDMYGTSGSQHYAAPRGPVGGVYTLQAVGVLPSCAVMQHSWSRG